MEGTYHGASRSEIIPPSFASILWSPLDTDENKKLLAGAKNLAADDVVVRGVPVTEELYDLILFTVHSFVRPMTTELYALKHNDVSIQERTDSDGMKRKRLLLTVRNGKTGMRMAHTSEGAVAPYKRLRERYTDATGEDYLFLPHYKNRASPARVFARQFNKLMDETGLKMDRALQTARTIYSVRMGELPQPRAWRQTPVNPCTGAFRIALRAGTKPYIAEWDAD
jgi:hypothetical protein